MNILFEHGLSTQAVALEVFVPIMGDIIKQRKESDDVKVKVVSQC